ncbi:MAG: DUF192 domain-containing protein [Candidatus Paceibacterota bacterium]
MFKKSKAKIFFLPIETRPKEFPPLLKMVGRFWHTGIIYNNKVYECFNFGRNSISDFDEEVNKKLENQKVVFINSKINLEKLDSEISSGTDCSEYVARVVGLSKTAGPVKNFWPEEVYKKIVIRRFLKIFFYFLITILCVFGFYRAFFASSFFRAEQKKPCGSYDQKYIKINEKIIKIDISDNDCKRTLGLSGRKELKNDTGMLFVFQKEGNHGFWMKDMNFPIDILWIDGDFNITGIEKSVATSTYPEIIGGNYQAKYVLELFSGFSEKNNIKVGNKIIFSE